MRCGSSHFWRGVPSGATSAYSPPDKAEARSGPPPLWRTRVFSPSSTDGKPSCLSQPSLRSLSANNLICVSPSSLPDSPLRSLRPLSSDLRQKTAANAATSASVSGWTETFGGRECDYLQWFSMDLWALNLSSSGSGGGVGVAAARASAWGRSREVVVPLERRRASWSVVNGVDDGEGLFCGGNGMLQMLGPACTDKGRRRSPGYRSREVRASGKKKGHGNFPSHGDSDPSVPEGDDSDGSNSISEETRPDGTSVQRSHHFKLDWRTFRANLWPAQDSGLSSEDLVSQKPSSKLGSKWVHPIPVPETGCVLIATDKLDGVRTFERSVVLLLRIGTRDPREGPFGIILNHPLNKKIRHMKPTNPDLATTFAECSLHFGGPLDASMFLLRTSENSPLPNFEQVIPGICFGTRNGLDKAAALVKRGTYRPQDFQFFVGYAGWQVDQLREEIESDYWIVAACSSDLIGSALVGSSSGLWVEILQLMGGQYTDLIRKAKEDDD
ncbi:hypothetical protein Taro_050538 [Colocasia esculenta]|uniref:Uncharacterized protein n=1 Tax=Colocasia esculenta TaxID=4460 RepID=A0A843XE94_COLES|nr:hypothetical protein [Colocasia esculenta]